MTKIEVKTMLQNRLARAGQRGDDVNEPVSVITPNVRVRTQALENTFAVGNVVLNFASTSTTPEKCPQESRSRESLCHLDIQ